MVFRKMPKKKNRKLVNTSTQTETEVSESSAPIRLRSRTRTNSTTSTDNDRVRPRRAPTGGSYFQAKRHPRAVVDAINTPDLLSVHHHLQRAAADDNVYNPRNESIIAREEFRPLRQMRWNGFRELAKSSRPYVRQQRAPSPEEFVPLRPYDQHQITQSILFDKLLAEGDKQQQSVVSHRSDEDDHHRSSNDIITRDQDQSDITSIGCSSSRSYRSRSPREESRSTEDQPRHHQTVNDGSTTNKNHDDNRDTSGRINRTNLNKRPANIPLELDFRDVSETDRIYSSTLKDERIVDTDSNNNNHNNNKKKKNERDVYISNLLRDYDYLVSSGRGKRQLSCNAASAQVDDNHHRDTEPNRHQLGVEFPSSSSSSSSTTTNSSKQYRPLIQQSPSLSVINNIEEEEEEQQTMHEYSGYRGVGRCKVQIYESDNYLGNSDDPETDGDHSYRVGGVGASNGAASSETAKHKIATLSNIGNTCYLNSVLYTLRFTPGFLENLHGLVESLSNLQRLDAGEQQRQTTNSAANEQQQQRQDRRNSLAVVFELHDLYRLMNRNETESSTSRTDNPTMMATTMSTMTMTAAPGSCCCSPLRPEGFLSAVQTVNKTFQGGRQQDSHELLICVLNTLRDAAAECARLAGRSQQSRRRSADTSNSTGPGSNIISNSNGSDSTSATSVVSSNSGVNNTTTATTSTTAARRFFSKAIVIRSNRNNNSKNSKTSKSKNVADSTNTTGANDNNSTKNQKSGGPPASMVSSTAQPVVSDNVTIDEQLQTCSTNKNVDATQKTVPRGFRSDSNLERNKDHGDDDDREEYDFIARDFQAISLSSTKCLTCEHVTEKRERMFEIPVPCCSTVDSNPTTAANNTAASAKSSQHAVGQSGRHRSAKRATGGVMRHDADDVDVGDCDDDEMAQSTYRKRCITAELLKGQNKYYCEECLHHVESRRTVGYDSLPRLLVLQLKRFSGGMEKINDHMPTPLVLDCFCNACLRHQQLRHRQHYSGAVDDNVVDSNVDPLPRHGPHRSVDNVDNADSRSRSRSRRRRSRQHYYRLYSVIMHIGATMSNGHYVAYTRATSTTTTEPQEVTSSHGKTTQNNGRQHARNSTTNTAGAATGVSASNGGKSEKSSSSSGVGGLKKIFCTKSTTAAGSNTNSATNQDKSNDACCAIKYGSSSLRRNNRNNKTTGNLNMAAADGRMVKDRMRKLRLRKRDEASEWFSCDDDNVKIITHGEFLEILCPRDVAAGGGSGLGQSSSSQTPYLLFYALCDDSDDDDDDDDDDSDDENNDVNNYDSIIVSD